MYLLDFNTVIYCSVSFTDYRMGRREWDKTEKVISVSRTLDLSEVLLT